MWVTLWIAKRDWVQVVFWSYCLQGSCFLLTWNVFLKAYFILRNEPIFLALLALMKGDVLYHHYIQQLCRKCRRQRPGKKEIEAAPWVCKKVLHFLRATNEMWDLKVKAPIILSSKESLSDQTDVLSLHLIPSLISATKCGVVVLSDDICFDEQFATLSKVYL